MNLYCRNKSYDRLNVWNNVAYSLWKSFRCSTRSLIRYLQKLLFSTIQCLPRLWSSNLLPQSCFGSGWVRSFKQTLLMYYKWDPSTTGCLGLSKLFLAILKSCSQYYRSLPKDENLDTYVAMVWNITRLVFLQYNKIRA